MNPNPSPFVCGLLPKALRPWLEYRKRRRSNPNPSPFIVWAISIL